MPYDHITFGLALVGFALLAADAARRFVGHRSTPLTMLSAAVVLAHVICIWAFRFEWSIERMWQKSAFAFLLFHGALVLIVASTCVGDGRRDKLVILAFAVVCAGAVPAPFRYPELAMLRIPVPAVFAAAVSWVFLQRRRSPS